MSDKDKDRELLAKRTHDESMRKVAERFKKRKKKGM